MKELVMKRRAELEDLCYKTHIQPDQSTAADKSSAMIDSGKSSNLGFIKGSVHRNFNAQKWIQSPFEGLVDPCELLANIEAQINNVKDEALSRKEIMDRIERWLSACDEENWLEDYNRVSKI